MTGGSNGARNVWGFSLGTLSHDMRAALVEINTTGKTIPRRIPEGPREIVLGPSTRSSPMRPHEAVVARQQPR